MAVPAAVTVATSLFSIYSSYQQIKAAKKAGALDQMGINLQSEFAQKAYEADLKAAELAGRQGELEAAAMRVQTALGQKQAAIAVEETLAQADQTEVENRKFLAEQSVAFTKSGVDLAGTPLMVLTQTKLDGVRDVQTLTKRARAIGEVGAVEASLGFASADATALTGAINKNTMITAAGLKRDQSVFQALYDSKTSKLRQQQNTYSGITTMLQGFSALASAA
jgi:hypothetical protein